jgi:hypothetical protein
MRVVTQGEDATFDVQLDPAADAGTVKWTLRDASGTAIGTLMGVTVNNQAEAQTVTIGVEAVAHASLGARFLAVSWKSAGVPRQQFLSYRVTRWFPITCTPDDVRGVLGLNADAELPDSDIDLAGAVEMVEVGLPNLLELLADPGVKAAQANRAVVLRTALTLAPSLPLRAAESMSSDSVAFKRFSKANLPSIIADIAAEYGSILQTLRGETEVTPTLFALTTREADPITGS